MLLAFLWNILIGLGLLYFACVLYCIAYEYRRFWWPKKRAPIPVPFTPLTQYTRDETLHRWRGFERSYDKTSFLVTGGCGFLGTALCAELLKRGAKRVVSFDMQKRKSTDPRLEYIVGDITDMSSVTRAMHGIDWVFHTAAIIDPFCMKDELMERVNIGGTANVCGAAVNTNVKGIVFTSSTAVLDGGEGFDGDETIPYPPFPVDTYCRTKGEAERTVLRCNGHAGVLTTAIRMFLFFGPNSLISNYMHEYRDNYTLFQPRPQPQGSCYIDNAVHAHLLCFERMSPDTEVSGRPFFITDDEVLPGYDVFVKMLRSELGVPPAKHQPPWVGSMIAYTTEAFSHLTRVLSALTCGLIRPRPPLLNRSQLHFPYDPHAMDISAAKKLLGYRPLVSVAEGCRLTGEIDRQRMQAQQTSTAK